MFFSKATGYGIRALAYLARQTEPGLCGLQEIAEHEKIPPVYLRKVLGELRRHRLLRSAKGIHGGYELARLPQTITLWEVFRVLEPDPYLDMCIMGRGQCNGESSCALHEDWQKVREEFVGLLSRKTISEVAAAGSACELVHLSTLTGNRSQAICHTEAASDSD
ncbi:MAG TPA: Rrf2 family transcriptional regulator [Blastocatellia bacterium]|nr:Rrf2 family transcriptional regulator [Blastocatellia bacterium]